MRYFMKEIVWFLLGLAVLIACMLEINNLNLPVSHQVYLFKVLYFLFVVVFVWFGLAMTGKGYRYLELYRPEIQKPFYFTYRLIQIIIVVIGILTLLEGLGAKISPLLGFFGVGGLATALAIQDTLINFISGIYIVLEKRFQLGDRVKSGENEGRVINIGWRATYLKADDGSMIIIPNKDFAQNSMINYSLGERIEEVQNGTQKSPRTDQPKG